MSLIRSTDEIRGRLLEMKMEDKIDFKASLLPTVDKDLILGISNSILRKFSKELYKNKEHESFLASLPHKYLEEYQLHGFLIEEIKDAKEVIFLIEEYLPYMDNWVLTDGLKPKIFTSHRDELFLSINKWIKDKRPYVRRFAIVMLMSYFLGDNFERDYLNMVIDAYMDHYYVNMARAWYFATALAKNYEKSSWIIEEKVLDEWTHRMTIRKASDSFRIDDKTKEYLKKYR